MGLHKKNNNEKTYIKYESGKIVELKSLPKSISNTPFNDVDLNVDVPDAIYQTYDSPDSPNKDNHTNSDTKSPLLRYLKIIFLSKVVRGIICLAIIAFMAYSILDAYQKIILSDDASPTAEVTTLSLPMPSNEDIKPTTSLGTHSNKQLSLKNIFDIIDTTNSIITDETSSEIKSIRACVDGTLTANELNAAVLGFLSQKEAAYKYLASYKTIFEDADILTLYLATESRLLNTISFSKRIIDMLKRGTNKDSLEFEISEFYNNEQVFTKEQTNAIINVLESKNIEFTYNKNTSTVSYSLI